MSRVRRCWYHKLLRQLHDEVVGIGGDGGIDNVVFRTVNVAISNIVSYGIVKEDRLLRDDGNLAAQRFHGDIRISLPSIRMRPADTS